MTWAFRDAPVPPTAAATTTRTPSPRAERVVAATRLAEVAKRTRECDEWMDGWVEQTKSERERERERERGKSGLCLG